MSFQNKQDYVDWVKNHVAQRSKYSVKKRHIWSDKFGWTMPIFFIATSGVICFFGLPSFLLSLSASFLLLSFLTISWSGETASEADISFTLNKMVPLVKDEPEILMALDLIRTELKSGSFTGSWYRELYSVLLSLSEFKKASAPETKPILFGDLFDGVNPNVKDAAFVSIVETRALTAPLTEKAVAWKF